MKINTYLLIFLSLNLFFGCAKIEIKPFTEDVKNIFKKNIVTESDIISAFKEVLQNATQESVNYLSLENKFLEDAEVTIPFPKEAKKVEQTLRKIGLNTLCDDFNKSMNLAAENAVKEATPIFIEAIKNMTFVDAKKILNGTDTAITDFLKLKTSTSLVTTFSPIVSEKLNLAKTTKQWSKIIEKYNKLPLVKPIQSDLTLHVTEKTVEAVFLMISKEEIKIRKNPSARASELIQKVFSQVDLD